MNYIIQAHTRGSQTIDSTQIRIEKWGKEHET